MRVTDAMRFDSVRRNLDRLNTEHAKTMQQAQTGNRLERPSDDPVAAATIARLRASQSSVATYQKVIGQVRGDVALAESSLSEASQLLQQASEIAIQAGNDSYNGNDRLALAEEVAAIKDQLVALGNTKGSRGQVFGGTATETPTFDTNGNFLGNDLEQVVEVGPGQSAVVNASGARAFTAVGGRDIFADLDALEAALRADDAAAIRGSIPGLDAGNSQVTRERARTGIILERLESSELVLDSYDLELTSSATAQAAIDPFATYSRLSELEQALEGAVTASRSLLSLGLKL